MTVYLSGPISLGGRLTRAEIDNNIAKFKAVSGELRKSGFEVLDPTDVPKQPSWEEYMRATIPMVCASDCVLLLAGWNESKGAVFEILIANTIGIPVFTDTFILLAALHVYNQSKNPERKP